MKRRMTIGVTMLTVATMVLAAGLLLATQAEAASGTLSIGSKTITPGAEGSVDLTSNVTSPGLGAWTVDITYDPQVLSVPAGGCSPQQGGVCNPAFSANQVRISGASASGLIGEKVLASITFHCNASGSTPLTLTTSVFADSTVGSPANVTPTITNGQIACIAPAATPTPTQAPPAVFHGFPIPGGTYVGEVRGTGTITVVVTPDGQGISEVRISDLVTPCGAFTHDLILDPALNIQEPGFSLNLGKVSEGSIGFSMTGLFAEDGTIPVDMQIGVFDPSCGEGSTLHVVLQRVAEAPAPRPQAPAPRPQAPGPTLYAPNAGSGPGVLGAGTAVWLVAGLIGAGIAWLCAGMAGASISALASAKGNVQTKAPPQQGFAPHMARAKNNDRRPPL